MKYKDTLRKIVDLCQNESSCAAIARYGEPMSAHTTFKVGGPADCWLSCGEENFPVFASCLFSHAGKAGIPVFILGGGANIVVSDKGIRGFVLDTNAWKGKMAVNAGDAACENTLVLRSGTSMDEAAEIAAEAKLSGLEFLAGMPGSIGGALWMNARCYGREIADVLYEAEIISFEKKLGGNPNLCDSTKIMRIPADKAAFGYKISPFQGKNCLILGASFRLSCGDAKKIRCEMEKNRQDRKAKGHYLFPSAGSVFKNNRDFGITTGEIIDGLGLRGFSIGGAQVAPFHGNIFINTGTACAADILRLKNEVAAKVKEQTGFVLEPEILFIGDW